LPTEASFDEQIDAVDRSLWARLELRIGGACRTAQICRVASDEVADARLNVSDSEKIVVN